MDDGQRRGVCRLAGGAVAELIVMGRVARLSIGGQAVAVAARGGTHEALYRDAVGRTDSFTGVRGNGGGVRHGRIPPVGQRAWW